MDLSFEERERDVDKGDDDRYRFLARRRGTEEGHSWTRLTFLHYARPDFRPIPRRVDGKGFAAASVRFAAIVGKIGGTRSNANGTTHAPTSFQSVKFDVHSNSFGLSTHENAIYRVKFRSTCCYIIRIYLRYATPKNCGRMEGGKCCLWLRKY